jgi:hypothetical protein
MAKDLGITCTLHNTYCPLGSGKVEHMKRTLKLYMGKLYQRTHLQYDQLLPVALLWIRSSPMKWPGLSPLKSFIDSYPLLIKSLGEELKEIGDFILRQEIQVLRLMLLKISDWFWERLQLA